MAYEKVEKETVYVDTDCEYEADDIINFINCGEDAPEEDSAEWYDRIAEMHEQDAEDFFDNIKYSKSPDLDDVVVKTHYSTRYPEFDHSRDMFAMDNLKKFGHLLRRFNPDGYKVYQNPDGLFIDTYHHDGSHHAEVRLLTEDGKKYVEHNDGNLTPDQMEKVFNDEHLSRAITNYIY